MPEGNTALWGGLVVDKLPILLEEKGKLVLNSILLISWEILEREEKWHCVIVYIFRLW